MFDLIIIGGGPAGVSAGVYAGRKQLHTLFITKDWGGQSTVSTDIQNWIGTPSISGDKLAADLKNHLLSYVGEYVTVEAGRTVASLVRGEGEHTVTLDNGTTYTARAILIASGSARRRLTIPGADQYEHKGLTYCASCDGPLFAGQDVAVIGGGNAGFETAAQLLAYTKSVTLISHGEFKADAITVEKVLSHPNMKAITHAEPVSVTGEQFVTSLTYRAKDSTEEVTIPVGGVFVEIGMIPNTGYAKDAVTLDAYGRVEIDPWTQKTTTPGIWAAGDCTNVKYHQNNIAAGDAVRALEDIYVTLKAH